MGPYRAMHISIASEQRPTRGEASPFPAAPTHHEEAVGGEGRGHDSRHDPRGNAAGEGEPLAGLPGARRDDLRQPLPRHQGETLAGDQRQAEDGHHHHKGFVLEQDGMGRSEGY